VTVVDDLLTSVRDALPSAVALNFTSATDPWDIFEAYTFALIVKAARADGYTVSYHGLKTVGGSAQFVFRRSPGSIWSPHFSYVHLSHGLSVPLELHVGVRIQGQSGVAHEADVAAIDAGEASQARANRFAPRSRGLLFLFECKYYATDLGLGILRGYLGLALDLRSHSAEHWLVSNVSHPELPSLLKHHNKLWADEVLPASEGEADLLRQVQSRLRRHRR